MVVKITGVVLDIKDLKRRLRALKGNPVRILQDGTTYGLYQHEGFVHWRSGQYVPGKPFFTIALESQRRNFTKGWKQVLEKGLDPEDFVDKIAYDALPVAVREAPIDTGNLRSTLKVSTPEEFGV